MSALPQLNNAGGKPPFWKKLLGAGPSETGGQPATAPAGPPVPPPVGPEAAQAASSPDEPGDGVVIRYPDPEEQAEILAEHEAECRRLEAKIAAEEAEILRNLPELPSGPPPEPKSIRRSPGAPVSSPPVVPSRQMLALTEANCFDLNNPPPPEEPRLLINGVPMCNPGNLTGIVSQSKRQKTAWLGGAIASMLGVPEGADCLGWQSPPSDGVILHVDTEQSRCHYWEAVHRALRRGVDVQAMKRLISYRVTWLGPRQVIHC